MTNELLGDGYHVLVIDQNIDTIASLKGEHVETIFGDASQFHILEKAQIEKAKLLIITVPDFAVTQLIVQTARNINPFIKIIARSRFKADLDSHGWNIPTICDEDATSDKFIELLHEQLKSSS